MTRISEHLPVITLNVNDLNSQSKDTPGRMDQKIINMLYIRNTF